VIKDPVLLGVSFILTIMPCASNCVLFATNYDSDEALAARTVFISTMLSLITIPLLVAICLR
jgi:predicted permease